jgi:hypothetical protein
MTTALQTLRDAVAQDAREDVDYARAVLGDDVALSKDERRARIAMHEAGHAVVCLALGIGWARFIVYEGTRGGRMQIGRDVAPRYRPVRPEDMIAVLLGGTVSELVVCGDVNPHGSALDYRVAVTIRGVDAVRAEVPRVRALLEVCRDPMKALALELSFSGSVDRAEAVQIVAKAGMHVPDEPIWAWGNAAEAAKVSSVHKQFARRLDEISELRKTAGLPPRTGMAENEQER